MFRQRNILCVFAARDGQKVLVRARIGLYEPRGEYQLVIDHMEDSGLGALSASSKNCRQNSPRKAYSQRNANARCP